MCLQVHVLMENDMENEIQMLSLLLQQDTEKGVTKAPKNWPAS
jgi:hypothetical protein